jgi:hypothetical protein
MLNVGKSRVQTEKDEKEGDPLKLLFVKPSIISVLILGHGITPMWMAFSQRKIPFVWV